ncbi:MAG: succinylglutamate desuccinylase/aspartoacylase family protein [Planctomycetia bacterium]|nr:succinylglutamate desuccinylase/aspartoacylase family protein [Planctomycetia bacterium]
MRVAFVSVVCSAVVLCGCAGQRAFRPATSSGGSSATDSPSGLGLPSPVLPGGSNSSSSYGPSGGSRPTLGPLLPSAKKSSGAGNAPRTALHAPAPRAKDGAKPADAAASTVSAFEKPLIVDNPTWSRYYRSIERRPIESTVIGTGARHIAIMASLHGDELQSQALVEELARSLRENPDLARKATVLLIKTPNPDGSLARSPYNTRGVDLNHNFPSANWTALDNKRSGARAGSEVETKAVMRLLSEFRPGLLVHIKDSRAGGFVNFDGAAQAQAEQMASLISCQVMQGRGARTSGSVENYAQTRLSCPSVTLLLPREASDAAAWTVNREALLSVIAPPAGGSRSNGPAADEQVNSINDQPDPFEEGADRKGSRKQRPQVRNTSKTDETSRLPEFPSPVPEHGYLELPAP